MGEVRRLIASDPALGKNLALLRGITGFGEVSAAILLAELPNIAEFTPKALAAFAGLSPREHSSGSSVRGPGKISRVGSQRLRAALYMCALSAKRTNKAMADFVRRMTAASGETSFRPCKPPKVILVAVARKLLVYAHAVIRTQTLLFPGGALDQVLMWAALATMVMITGYSIIAVPTGIFTAELANAMRQDSLRHNCPTCDKLTHEPNAAFCSRCGSQLFEQREQQTQS